MTKKTKFAHIGLGGRSFMYTRAVCETFHENSQLVALCDRNPGRLSLAQQKAASLGAPALPLYAPDQFEIMIRETQPDCIIVTTMDSTHDDYICRAMELGCDVVTEKPMTIDEVKCRKILDVQKKTGRDLRVTFNYRYAPPRTLVKELLMSGVIGEVLTVDFQWLLDTHHGADYYRRWHRNKRNSGGLLVHKATHHFDLVNWWLSAVPQSVSATGKRHFYLPQTADRLQLLDRSDRCSTCGEISKCPFALDMKNKQGLRELYLQNEHFDGYFRDRCVFDPDIDIEDSMHASVEYDTGARLNYSLTSFSAWEGYSVSFNGTKGRSEHKAQESVYINGDGTVPGQLQKEGTEIRVYPFRANPYSVPIPKSEGGHGGADPVLLADIFGSNQEKDPYLRAADQRSGALSILCGIAANLSIQSGKPVSIESLIGEVERPDYPVMPGPESSIVWPDG